MDGLEGQSFDVSSHILRKTKVSELAQNKSYVLPLPHWYWTEMYENGLGEFAVTKATPWNPIGFKWCDYNLLMIVILTELIQLSWKIPLKISMQENAALFESCVTDLEM